MITIVKTAKPPEDPLSRFEEIPEEQAPWAEEPAETEPVEQAEPIEPEPVQDPAFKVEPKPAVQPVDPASIAEEVPPPSTDLDTINADPDPGKKIYVSIRDNLPLKITYTTLPRKENPSGSTTNRVVDPDFVYWAGTNRNVMVAWCRLRGDWRAFAVDGIREAEVLPY